MYGYAKKMTFKFFPLQCTRLFILTLRVPSTRPADVERSSHPDDVSWKRERKIRHRLV
jgi:hypothetical protein